MTLIPSIQVVVVEVGNGSVISNEGIKVVDENRFHGKFSDGDDFGVSTKISDIEGAFSVVATDDIGGVYVAYQSFWMDNSGEFVSIHVYFIYSLDYGESWSENIRVNDNGSSSVQCSSPSIAIDKKTGHIFVAWKDNRTGVAKVYIDKSIDRDVSFGSDVSVYDSPNDYYPPWYPYPVNIEINSKGNIYVTWIAYHSDSYTDRDIFFASSIDGGQTFSTPITINSMENEARFSHPWIAIEDENVLYIVYSKLNSTNSDVYLAKSQNGGLSFETPAKVTDVSTQRYLGGTQVTVASDGKIHIVWTDGRAGTGTQYLDIYYAISSDGGISFGTNIRVNDDIDVAPPSTHPHFTRGVQGTPSFVTDSNSTVHIFWEDFRNFVNHFTYCRDIYYASRSDTQFSDNLKVNYIHPDSDSVNCADPNIAIDSQDNFFIVYSDAPSGDNNYHYIYFMFVPSPTTPTTTNIVPTTTASHSKEIIPEISTSTTTKTSKGVSSPFPSIFTLLFAVTALMVIIRRFNKVS